jgi:hypothetical protein
LGSFGIFSQIGMASSVPLTAEAPRKTGQAEPFRLQDSHPEFFSLLIVKEPTQTAFAIYNLLTQSSTRT